MQSKNLMEKSKGNFEIFGENSFFFVLTYRSLVKNCPEFIRTSMLTFFNNIADDLGHTISNLHDVSNIKSSCDLNFRLVASLSAISFQKIKGFLRN